MTSSTPPPADSVPTLPTPETLDATWLNAALTAGGVWGRGVWGRGDVSELRMERIGAEFGLAGRSFRIDGSTRSGAVSLAVKFATADAVDRSRVSYELAGGVLGAGMPTVFAGAADHPRERGILVMDHVADATQGDVLTGCGAAAARHIVELLARLHGAFVAPDAAEFPEALPRWGPRAMDVDRWRDRLGRAATRYPDLLSSAFHDRLRELPARFADAVEPFLEDPVTLIHADVHLDNALIRADESVVLLDWDIARVGPGVVDLARFLVEGAPREQHAELIVAYVEAARAAGAVDLRVSAVTDDIRAALIPLLQGAVGWAGAPSDDSALSPRVLALRRHLLECMCAWFDG